MRLPIIASGILCALLAPLIVSPEKASGFARVTSGAAALQKRRPPRKSRSGKAANPAPPALVKSGNGLKVSVLSFENAGQSWTGPTGATLHAEDGEKIMLLRMKFQSLPAARGGRTFEFPSPALYLSDGSIGETALSRFVLHQYAGKPINQQMVIPFLVPEGATPGALTIGDFVFDLAELGEAQTPAEAAARPYALPDWLKLQQEISEALRKSREEQRQFEEINKRVAETARRLKEDRKRFEEMEKTRKLLENIRPLKIDLNVFPKPLPSPTPAPTAEIVIPAARFVRGVNVEVGVLRQWGSDFVHNAAPYRLGTPNEAEYEVKVEGGGDYDLSVQLAAEEARPVDIVLNGETVYRGALNVTTGGWHQDGAKWFDVGRLRLRPGGNSLVVRRADVFPHLLTLRLTPAKQ